MSLPSVCVLIPTYARTGLLAEALFSALQQDYRGEVQVFIANDCERQKIEYDGNHTGAPRSRVLTYNYAKRFPALGAKRDAMLRDAPDSDWYFFLDDDDLFMPWHISTLIGATRHDESIKASIPAMQFRLHERAWTLGEMPGGCAIAVERGLARTVGFNHELNLGEDNEFRQGVLQRCGRYVGRPGVASYAYRADTAGYHISKSFANDGFTSDPKNFVNDYERRMNEGIEPTGDVMITPAWKEDYWRTLATIFPSDVAAR